MASRCKSLLYSNSSATASDSRSAVAGAINGIDEMRLVTILRKDHPRASRAHPPPTQAMEWVCPPGEKVWVKVVEVTEDPIRGPKVACSVKVVDQNDGRAPPAPPAPPVPQWSQPMPKCPYDCNLPSQSTVLCAEKVAWSRSHPLFPPVPCCDALSGTPYLGAGRTSTRRGLALAPAGPEGATRYGIDTRMHSRMGTSRDEGRR